MHWLYIDCKELYLQEKHSISWFSEKLRDSSLALEQTVSSTWEGNWLFPLYQSAPGFVKGCHTKRNPHQLSNFSYFILCTHWIVVGPQNYKTIWRRYSRRKKKKEGAVLNVCFFSFLQKYNWLLSFQETVNLSWLCGIHSSRVHTKWTLADSLMWHDVSFVRTEKETLPCAILLFSKENGGGKNKGQVKAIYVLWHTSASMNFGMIIYYTN